MLVQPSNERSKQQEQKSIKTEDDGTLWGEVPSLDHVEGNSFDLNSRDVPEKPVYLPEAFIYFECQPPEFPGLLGRLSKEFRASNMQVKFISSPLSAKVETIEGVQLYVGFLQERHERKNDKTNGPKELGQIYMTLQRRKGDAALAAQYIRRLSDAAKGIGSDSEQAYASDVSFDPELLREIENLVDRQVSAVHGGGNPFKILSQEQIAETSVKDICANLKAKTFSLRTRALEALLHMTNMKRTVSTSAVAGALVVLNGKGPTEALDGDALEIQKYLLLILMKREIPEDRVLLGILKREENREIPEDRVALDILKRKENRDVDDEMSPYFPDRSANAPDLSDEYCDHMNDLFHVVLQIVVQSLEVATCLHETFERKHDEVIVEGMAGVFVTRCSEVADGKDLYKTLLGCIGRSALKLSDGYLACKALRLLVIGSPQWRDRLMVDEFARKVVGAALEEGAKSHPLLRDESKQLWRTVRGH
jgi:hypothetical protein